MLVFAALPRDLRQTVNQVPEVSVPYVARYGMIWHACQVVAVCGFVVMVPALQVDWTVVESQAKQAGCY